MKTRDQETTDTGIDHNAGITSDNVALNVSAAILVGGEARRFGGQVKPALPIGDARILDRQLVTLRAAGIVEVMLIGRWSQPPVAAVRHWPDVVDGAGALGGLYSALLAASTGIVVVLAGDMPFVTSTWVRRLVKLGDDDDAMVARVDGRWHPLCAAYRRRCAMTLKRQLDRGRLRLTEVLSELTVREVGDAALREIDPTGRLLMNVNTPDDHREAMRLLSLP